MNSNVILKIERLIQEANNDQELNTLQNKPQSMAEALQNSGTKGSDNNSQPNILDQPELTPNPTVIPDDDSGVPAALLKSFSNIDN
jgi:hypothetical protein